MCSAETVTFQKIQNNNHGEPSVLESGTDSSSATATKVFGRSGRRLVTAVHNRGVTTTAAVWNLKSGRSRKLQFRGANRSDDDDDDDSARRNPKQGEKGVKRV